MPVLSLQFRTRKGQIGPFSIFFSGAHVCLQHGIPAMGRSGKNTDYNTVLNTESELYLDDCSV